MYDLSIALIRRTDTKEVVGISVTPWAEANAESFVAKFPDKLSSGNAVISIEGVALKFSSEHRDLFQIPIEPAAAKDLSPFLDRRAEQGWVPLPSTSHRPEIRAMEVDANTISLEKEFIFGRNKGYVRELREDEK